MVDIQIVGTMLQVSLQYHSLCIDSLEVMLSNRRAKSYQVSTQTRYVEYYRDWECCRYYSGTGCDRMWHYSI